jgi:glycerol kinase
MVFHTRDIIDAMTTAGGVSLKELRVDGGASVMDEMLQRQSNELQVPVLRPTDHETTALGAAYLAGLAEGVWSSLDEVQQMWTLDLRCEPQEPSGNHPQWLRAVERSQRWASNTTD